MVQSFFSGRRAGIAVAATLMGCVVMAGASAQIVGEPAVARTGSIDQDRLVRIEQQLRDLQGVLYAADGGRALEAVAGTSLPNAVAPDASLAVRLTRIEQNLATMTGRMEELTFKLDRLGNRLESLEAGDASPAEVLGGDPIAAAAAAAQGGPVDLVTGDDAAALQPRVTIPALPARPDAAYNMAYDYLLAADYDRAELAFAAFIERFPESPQTPEAKYFLGEIYLSTRANADAARTFLDHVRSYPDDPRAPEAYLKLGTAFQRLDKPDESCRVLAVGQRQFPSLDARLTRRYDEVKAEAGCDS